MRAAFLGVMSVVLTIPLLVVPAALAAQDGESVRDLSRQVWALQSFHDLELTPAQLKAIGAMVPAAEVGSGDKPEPLPLRHTPHSPLIASNGPLA